MAQTHYRDLAEFGLPLIMPGAATFAALVRDIEARPQPFGSWPIGDSSTAAVLLNQTGQAIVTLDFFWRYTLSDGTKRTSRYSNLGSSMQTELLCGRAKVLPDLGSFILAGSKRLITEQGMFGNNLDVLPPNAGTGHGGGYLGVGGGGSRNGPREEMAETELCLDLAILEDGLCVGPDDAGLLDNITNDVQRQRETAQEIVAALHNGASAGKIFEILRPLARPFVRHGREFAANFRVREYGDPSADQRLWSGTARLV